MTLSWLVLSSCVFGFQVIAAGRRRLTVYTKSVCVCPLTSCLLSSNCFPTSFVPTVAAGTRKRDIEAQQKKKKKKTLVSVSESEDGQ
jgi:hypothetical protein